MSRKWESYLRRDSSAWTDFKQWLHELEQQQIQALMSADDFERQRGRVDGVRVVIHAATLNEKEEQQRARRQG